MWNFLYRHFPTFMGAIERMGKTTVCLMAFGVLALVFLVAGSARAFTQHEDGSITLTPTEAAIVQQTNQRMMEVLKWQDGEILRLKKALEAENGKRCI